MDELIMTLKQIRSRDDLLLEEEELESSFLKLAKLMVRADHYKQTDPNANFTIDEASDSESHSEQLRIEMNRVMRFEGGREILIKAQEKAMLLLSK